jgi:hypothetical protein
MLYFVYRVIVFEKWSVNLMTYIRRFYCYNLELIYCSLDMVHLPGKGVGARRVPILLTPDVVCAMTTLVAQRSKCGIPSTNPYFFATPSESGYLNGWQAMRNVSEAAELKRPELIHSTRLRKYIATVSQVEIIVLLEFLTVYDNGPTT